MCLYKSCWIDEIFLDRDTKSEFVLVEKLLQVKNPEQFRQYL